MGGGACLRAQGNDTMRELIALRRSDMSERADVCLACMSRRGPSLCAAACVVSKAGEHESVGQGAVDKIAATRLAPVCYSHRKIVVKTVFIPTDPRPCSPEMLLSTC